MNQAPSLPIDILRLILLDLASTNARLVHPCLFVCRQMYHLAIPLLYNEIMIYGGRCSASSYMEKLERGHAFLLSLCLLKRTFSDNSSLAAYTQTFAVEQAGVTLASYPTEILTDIYKHLINLTHVYVNSYPYSGMLSLVSLPQAARLTHLTVLDDPNPSFTALLARQPTLLSLELNLHVCHPFQLSPSAIPCLQSLFSDSALWDTIVPGRPVQLLVGPLPDSSRLTRPKEIFQNIRSLSIRLSNIREFRTIAPFLERIETLCLIGTQDGFDFSSDGYALIPSSHLWYVRLEWTSSRPPRKSAAQYAEYLLETLPSVVLVGIFLFRRVSFRTFRLKSWHTRDGGTPLDPPPEVWERWWEPIRGAVCGAGDR